MIFKTKKLVLEKILLLEEKLDKLTQQNEKLKEKVGTLETEIANIKQQQEQSDTQSTIIKEWLYGEEKNV